MKENTMIAIIVCTFILCLTTCGINNDNNNYKLKLKKVSK